MGLLADIHKDLEVGALRLLVEYRARLHDAAVKLCDDETQADDLVFRTIERVLAKPDSYKVDSNLFGWMLSIMENIHLNDIKRPVVRGTVAVDDATMEEYAGADWSTDEQILKNSDCEAVRAALRDIPPEYKQTVILRFYEDLSLKEIASILNKPVGTVGRRIHVALHLLAGKLRAEFGKAKKPLAVFLAALLGVGALFGAWQTGLLDPLLSQKGEAESFPLQEEITTTQIQPQSETCLTQEESQSETTKEQTMNMKTVKTLAATAVVAANAVVLNAATSAGYVQDGLIAMWDGYENNGAGGHATELTEWKDTTGRYSFVFDENSGIEVGDDRLVFSGASGCCAELNADGTANTFARASDGTVEVVFKAASDTPSISFVLHSTVSSGIAFSRYGSFGSAMQWIVSNKYSPMSVFNAHEEVTTVVLQYASGVASNSFVNGQVTAKSGSDNWGSAGAGTMLGARGGTKTNPFKGEVCAIRLYSTPLTPEQIKANRSVDVKRFMEGKLGDGPGVTVWGSPKSYATATGVPQYGFFPCAEGKTFTMSMPPSFVAADGHTIECLGWKRYDSASGALIDESTEQDKLTCEFNFATDVKLVWQWRVLNVLTVRNFDEDLATVYVNDEPATNGQRIVNCTVVENTHTTPVNKTENDFEGLIGGVGRSGGTVVNCLIAENYNTSTGGMVRADIAVAKNSSKSGYSTTCASPLELMPADAGNVSSVPGPVYRYSKRLGEYRLPQSSPCAGAGTWQTWMEGALDIYGRAWNPDRVDIGAAVYDCKGLMLLVK